MATSIANIYLEDDRWELQQVGKESAVARNKYQMSDAVMFSRWGLLSPCRLRGSGRLSITVCAKAWTLTSAMFNTRGSKHRQCCICYQDARSSEESPLSEQTYLRSQHGYRVRDTGARQYYMMSRHWTRTDIELGEYIGRSRNIEEEVTVTATEM